MASQALYTRWRPASFEDVVGQEHVIYTVRNALATGRIAHAYLFTGPRGTGKTTMARLLAKAVNCLAEDMTTRPCNQCPHCISVAEGRFLDLIEIDAASHTSVDDVRELRERIAFAPNEGRYKVYIIDEVHRFSGAAFDALLKTIEEPPAHAVFVLATTEVHKVPQTIVSRCQRFDFRRIPLWQIVERLTGMAEAEGIQVEQAALELIARQATGSLRDAISLFDQMISRPDEMLTLELAQAILGTASNQVVQALTDMIIDGKGAEGLGLIAHTLDQGADPRQLARQMVEYLRLLMILQTGGAGLIETLASQEDVEIISRQAGVFPRRALLESIRLFNEAIADPRGGWQPQLPLELALMESIETLHTAPAPAAMPAAEARASQPAEVIQGAAKAQTPPPLVGTVTLELIQSRWVDVLAQVGKQNRAAEALLRSGGLIEVSGDTVIFGVTSDVLRERLAKDDSRSAIEAALLQICGAALKIQGRVVSESAVKKNSKLDDVIANDSLVAFTVNELGGRVRHVETDEE
jgi:DNA polymerase-3 subunit gamma/tau